MLINSELNYKPVSYKQLTEDKEFWAGCQSCVNYKILASKNQQHCMCTAMLYDPAKEIKNKEEKMKVVLAFSGGLDTSYCVKHLIEDEGYEVHTVTVDTGGFSDQELMDIERRAYTLGATTHQSVKATSDFYKKCVRYLIFGNVLKNNCYPLCVSAERIFQAWVIANKALEIKADAIAHGSTGAGNDQIRFDMMFHIMCPEVKIITPIRDQKLSREQEQDYLKKHHIACSDKVTSYSINQGLWGTSVGGCETLTSHKPLPESAWPTQMDKNSDDKISIKITFEKGEPIAIDDKAASPIAIIKQLQRVAQPYGIGRDVHVGDTIINIKGRVGFEAAAPLILIKAHHLLEKHVLTKAQLKLKDQIAVTYGELIHEGQFMEPVLRDIEAYLLSSQKRVCGDVFIEISPWQLQILGCQSKYDLMAAEGSTYGESNESWTADDVKGFSKILSNQLRAYKKVEG
ncbi:MAG: argininosuccinate synthase [Francisellaceae bacterium]|jgi:argininosuccinate synthase